MLLKRLNFEYKGITFHIDAKLRGNHPIYMADCLIESPTEEGIIGMRYDMNKQVFLDGVFESSDGVTGISEQENDELRLRISHYYSKLVNAGLIKFDFE